VWAAGTAQYVLHLVLLNGSFKWVSYFKREQGRKLAEVNLWDHFGKHYYMLWWHQNFDNNLSNLFTKKTGPPYRSVPAASECSHTRVGKLLGQVISRGFVVRTQHFRILGTCRTDFLLVNKGFNVYVIRNLAHQLKRKFKFILPVGPPCLSVFHLDFPFLNNTLMPPTL